MALPTASDNPFPSLLVTEGSAPSSPASGKQRVYIDSADHLLKRKNSGGTVTTIEGAGGLPTDGWVSSTGWSYSSADSPTFVIATSSDLSGTIPVGARIKLTQTTAKYFIVTAIDASTITVYGGTDYTLANAAITLPYWSPVKSPFGFPLDPDKWTVATTNTSLQTEATPVAGTWYNTGAISIVVPIGCWRVWVEVTVEADRNVAAVYIDAYGTLSTANNSETDKDFTGYAFTGDASATGKIATVSMHREKVLTLSSKSTRYLNIKTTGSSSTLYIQGATSSTKLRAVCAYL